MDSCIPHERRVQYVGSFPVSANDSASRSDLLRRFSHAIRRGDGSPRPVLLVVSLAGIKVCSPNGNEVWMGHALKRICFSLCEPSLRLFSYLARESSRGSSSPQQYCHTFLASTPHQSEELNAIVGNAFRMAYASQLSGGSDLPSTAAAVNQNSTTINQNSTTSTLLLRHNQANGNHHTPSDTLHTSQHTTIHWPKQIPGRAGDNMRVPDSIPGLVTSQSGSSGQSVIADSPTELNSVARLVEKPPHTKTLPITPIQANPPPSIINPPGDHSSKLIDIDNNRVDPKRCGSSCSSSSNTPPLAPARTGSLRPLEAELKQAPWFQAGIPREITLEVLREEPVGSFMVRESSSKPGCFALSLRVPTEFQQHGIAHYLILRTNKGFKINGFNKEFSTLTSLITHHSVMPELLPCPLSLARYNPSYNKSDGRDGHDTGSEESEEPDYNTLADFRRMMADLNV